MLTKLMVTAPEQVHSRLDAIATNFRTVLMVKPKDNAVKQEIEKIQEGGKGVLRVTVLLNKQLGTETAGGKDDQQSRTWAQYWEWVTKEHGLRLKEVMEELKERDR
jgi:cullin-associated NEDD8-dissociated protein 1